jgi:hypothetical protein
MMAASSGMLSTTSTEHRGPLTESVVEFVGRGTDIARVRRLRGNTGGHDIGGAETNFLTPFYYPRLAACYGGTSDIQRNIAAKHMLRLPD